MTRKEEAFRLTLLDDEHRSDTDPFPELDDDGVFDHEDDRALLGLGGSNRNSDNNNDGLKYFYRDHRNWSAQQLAQDLLIPFLFIISFVRRLFRSRLQHTPSKQYPYATRRGWIARYISFSIWGFITLSVFNGILRSSYQAPPAHYQALEARISRSTEPGRGNPNNEKIFIAANIINADLIRHTWGNSVAQLVELLGPENAFVSVYENDSGEETSQALRDLAGELSCNSSIITSAHLPLTGFPTVHLPNGDERVQRIAYLAEVRNKLLRPLAASPSEAETATPAFMSVADTKFDRILFINDVYFDPREAVQLLFSTNVPEAQMNYSDDSNVGFGRAQYRTACAVDFVHGIMFYDSFVVRDTEGFQMGLMFWPWFTTLGSGTTRSQVRQQVDTVSVRSCWGGMAAFDAALFQTKRSDLPPETEMPIIPTASSGSATSPNLPLTFRGSGEAFWEAAECCLIFADAEVLFGYPSIEQGTGVFLNPYVRVAYTQMTWDWLPFWRRYERTFEFLQWIVSKIGYPEFNPRRLHEPGQEVVERVWTKHSPEEGGPRFDDVQREASPGGFCGQRRMFVMKKDLEEANRSGSGKNWEKVRIPPGL